MTTRIPGHRITWYVWASAADGGNRTKLRHSANMRGRWESRTGGATKESVRRDVWDHKLDVHLAAQEA